jgi:Na+-transporting methylmalonyl-CoA/oxaloacetate decarboxylase beta subunit
MRSFRFDAEGFSRTYWDFYVGFGLIISVYLIVQAIVLWQIAALSKTQPVLVRPIAIAFIAANLASALLSWVFFFATPAVFALLIAVSLGLALTAADG